MKLTKLTSSFVLFFLFIGVIFVTKLSLAQTAIPLSITTNFYLPNATAGMAYETSVNAVGGEESYMWSVTNGLLPPGFNLVVASCFTTPCQTPITISGIPRTPGVYTFFLTVVSGKESYVKDFEIIVIANTPPKCNMVNGDNGGSIISNDGGATFISNTRILPDFHFVALLAIPRNETYYQFIYTHRPDSQPKNTSTVSGLYQSLDGACNWNSIDNSYNFNVLAQDIYNPEIFYASNYRLYLKPGINEPFYTINIPSNEFGVRNALSVGPGRNGLVGILYVITEGPYNDQSGNYRIYKSLDRGSSFINITPTNKPTLSAITLVVPDPHNENVIYLATSGSGGIFKTENGGSDWKQIKDVFLSDTKDRIYNILMLDINPNNTQELFVKPSTQNSGRSKTFHSTDGGKNWVEWIGDSNNRGVGQYLWINRIYFDRSSPSISYITANIPNQGGSVGYLYKSINGGNSYALIRTENGGISQLIIDPNDNRKFLIGRAGLVPTNFLTSSTPTPSSTLLSTPNLPPTLNPTTPTSTYIQVQTDVLNVRQDASLNTQKIGLVLKGEVLKKIEERAGWVKVELSDGQTGWIFGQYVTPTTTNILAPRQKVTITALVLNVRSGPGVKNSIISKVQRNNIFEKIGENYGWIKVILQNGQTGWVFGQFVK